MNVYLQIVEELEREKQVIYNNKIIQAFSDITWEYKYGNGQHFMCHTYDNLSWNWDLDIHIENGTNKIWKIKFDEPEELESELDSDVELEDSDINDSPNFTKIYYTLAELYKTRMTIPQKKGEVWEWEFGWENQGCGSFVAIYKNKNDEPTIEFRLEGDKANEYHVLSLYKSWKDFENGTNKIWKIKINEPEELESELEDSDIN